MTAESGPDDSCICVWKEDTHADLANEVTGSRLSSFNLMGSSERKSLLNLVVSAMFVIIVVAVMLIIARLRIIGASGARDSFSLRTEHAVSIDHYRAVWL